MMLALALLTAGFSQDINVMYREAQRLEESKKEIEALKKYLDIIKYQPAHITALCKASELNTVIGSRQQEKEGKLQYFRTARKYAEAALRINPNFSEANLVMAMAMGRMAMLLNGSDKIHAVSDIKKYAEVAIRSDPGNFKAYHVLGKWHYEVSSLNAFERMGVKVFYGGLPASSFAESIKYYEKSRSLNPEFALNYLEVAKAYIENNQVDKAIELLKKLQTIPVKTTDDPKIKSEGNKLLKQLLN
jgi:tetratricopeptide (TPR) repeat protein